MLFSRSKSRMIEPSDALPGREERLFLLPSRHQVLGNALEGDIPTGHEVAVFGMGCFWGAERLFWQTEGVWSTSVGYAGGYTPHPTYDEVCSGRTGHAEVVRVVFDPERISYEQLLKVFWENHDPTSGMRQGNDVGTQYRSTIFVTSPEQRDLAETSAQQYGSALGDAGYGDVTTEISEAGDYWFAEPYHQQYLHRVPGGYCNHGFCQVAYADAAAAG